MIKPIRFTRHAQQKLTDLARLGFTVIPDQVIEAVRNPEYVDTNQDPPVAQRAISERHLIRVVFGEDENELRNRNLLPSQERAL